MKAIKIIPTLMLCTAGLFNQVQADEPIAPKKVSVDFTKLYIPDGYEANNNVEIVGEGMFENACYRRTNPTVQVNEETRTIDIGPAAYKYNGLCLQVVLSFNAVIDLGVLKAGDYNITQNSGKALGKIHVGRARTSDPDDYLYAPISQAYFKKEGLFNQVLLNGSFPVSCMKIKELRVHIQPDVLVIQPIAYLDKSVACVVGQYHFDQLVDVGAMKSGRYLLHVRSINGHSVNSLIDVP